ncbi:efflux RND transporter permease subunit [Luteimonas sp. RD2P54]|uniref:Efflux RND transporter permease subunit n=1 Tax=Luteimonas endophytica TaxID=3042023 RepID=A0ABT6JBV6_9GAMM|nr:efflux RND transporter permease subunit [Luteimonas endophytica]MDH5823678.1 efflux RND transporter permease subunit [Luteimonas endophytica]
MAEAPPGPDSEGPRESEEVRVAGRLQRFFLLKTTFGILLALLLSVGGFTAYTQLVKEALPDLEIPQATITTQWPGSDPETIEEQVTTEIEDELTTLSGVNSVNSASFDSYSIIMVEFEADADASDAMQRLRAAVSTAEAELPADANAPEIEQISVDDRPVITIALSGGAGTAALSGLGKEVQERLERIQGVSEAELGGDREEIVQILLQPERLLALGLSPLEVRDAIGSANLEQPFGEIESAQIGAIVRLEGQFRSVEDLRSLPVRRAGGDRAGPPVRLEEVAVVQRTREAEESTTAYSNRGEPYRPSIEISVRKTPGADTLEMIDAVLEELRAMQEGEAWEAGVRYDVIQDDAETIRDSLGDVFVNGLQAMAAVFVILFLVLTWREGLIAGLAIPVTFAGALIVVLLLGYSLNELVIIGMVLALGLMVDVFILMMEGMHDEIYVQNKSYGQAALATVDNYAMPAFAGQLTTILAMAPLMAIGGVAGKFIRVLPITAITCLVIAFIVALLAAVPLSRYLLGPVARKRGGNRKRRADRITESASKWLKSFICARVVDSRKHAWTWVGGAAAGCVLSLVAFSQIPSVLFPKTDGERLGINIELPPATQLDRTQEVADAVGEILREKAYFDSVIKIAGRKSPFILVSPEARLQPTEGRNFIGFSATFVDRGERDAQSYELADGLRDELQQYLSAHVAGASLLVVPETNQQSTGEPIEVALSGPDMRVLQRLSQNVQGLLERTEGVADVRDNLGDLSAEIALRPDREGLSFYGISQQELAAQARFALGIQTIGTFAVPGPTDDLDIRMGTNWPSRQGDAGGPRRIDELDMVRAFTPHGQSVPMLALLDPVQGEAILSISHEDGRRALTVLAGNQGRPVTEIVEEIRPELEKMRDDWPSGYDFDIGGEAEETAETFGSAGIALVIALIMVFGVLVIVFDSFPQAFILLVTMPLALIGSFFGFFLFGMEFSFFAMVGVISLIGIVANDGIVMVDTMNRRLAEGVDKARAAARGAAERLRPILTTSATTIAGLVPLAIGNPMFRPLCFMIIFGLVSATIMQLFVVPALYFLLTRKAGGGREALD